MFVMFVDKFLSVMMIMDHFLRTVGVSVEMLNAVAWFVDPTVRMSFTDMGGSYGVGISSMNDNLRFTPSTG